MSRQRKKFARILGSILFGLIMICCFIELTAWALGEAVVITRANARDFQRSRGIDKLEDLEIQVVYDLYKIHCQSDDNGENVQVYFMNCKLVYFSISNYIVWNESFL